MKWKNNVKANILQMKIDKRKWVKNVERKQGLLNYATASL